MPNKIFIMKMYPSLSDGKKLYIRCFKFRTFSRISLNSAEYVNEIAI